MAPLRPAVHRTVLVVDVASFGDLRRTNQHQIVVRDGMYGAVIRAFADAGIDWDTCEHEDRGDGVLVVIPPTVPKAVLVEEVPDRLTARLRAHNESHRVEERIRLRMALHAGEVHYDDHGVVGRAVNLTFRLLEVPVLKEALAGSTGSLAIITSSWFFDEVVWHGEATRRDRYRRVRVVAKETDTIAWICLPDGDQMIGPVAELPPRSVSGLPVPRQLPAGYHHFVGRVEELYLLMRLLDESVTGVELIITAIDGMAGVGKTTLAVHWAQRIKDRFPDGQLYVNLRGFDPREPADPGEALRGFLGALGMDVRNIPDQVDDRSALYRSVLAGRRVLILLDNARSPEQVRPLLPGTPDCLVIITSRHRMDGLAVRDGAHRITLGALTDDEAFALLARQVDLQRLTAAPAAVAELIDLCAKLPLALSIVAARAADSLAVRLDSLVRELRDRRHRLDTLDLGDIDLSMRTVLSWSYMVLSQPAARMFRLLGVHPGTDCDRYACEALAGSAGPALRELDNAHLLTEHVPGRYRRHDLVRAYAAELAEDDPEHDDAVDRLLQYYLRTAYLADRRIQPATANKDVVRPQGSWVVAPAPVPDYPAAMAWFSAEIAALIALVVFTAERGDGTSAWQLAWTCRTFLRRTGRRHERAAVHRVAWEAVHRSGDRDDEVTALSYLAAAVARLGRHDEALGHLRNALTLARSLDDRVAEIHIQLTFARVYEQLANPSVALGHAETACDLLREGDDSLVRADALTTLGRQLLLAGRCTEALPASAAALDIYSAVGRDEGQADALTNLGEIEHRLGRQDRAVAHYERSLELDRLLGDRFWEAYVLDRLADIRHEAGESARAAAEWRRALALLDELGHPDAAQIRAKLSAVPPDPVRAPDPVSGVE